GAFWGRTQSLGIPLTIPNRSARPRLRQSITSPLGRSLERSQNKILIPWLASNNSRDVARVAFGRSSLSAGSRARTRAQYSQPARIRWRGLQTCCLSLVRAPPYAGGWKNGNNRHRSRNRTGQGVGRDGCHYGRGGLHA